MTGVPPRAPVRAASTRARRARRLRARARGTKAASAKAASSRPWNQGSELGPLSLGPEGRFALQRRGKGGQRQQHAATLVGALEADGQRRRIGVPPGAVGLEG